MKKWMVLLVGLLLVAGCSGSGGTAEPVLEEAVMVSQEAADKVASEAAIEPARWSELRFTSGGMVVEVLVCPGDKVAEGDLLVRLDSTDAELAVQEAEAALAAAQAQLAQVKAGPRPEQIAEAKAQLSDARAALSQAVARRDELTSGAIEADVAAAQAELAAAQAEWLRVREEHRDVHEDEGSDWSTKEDADYRLYAANEAVTAAQVKLEAQQNTTDARLRDANAGVWLASVQQDLSQAEIELLKAGITSEEIAVSEAVVQQAEATLATAKAALEHTEIRAPFAGVVTKINLDAGETAAPGQVIVVLATLDWLQVRTTDLTELDVAQVTEGQAATVTVDALPAVRLRGHVVCIDLKSMDYQGDVTYPVTVELDEDVPDLRWGMTVMVEIEVN